MRARDQGKVDNPDIYGAGGMVERPAGGMDRHGIVTDHQGG